MAQISQWLVVVPTQGHEVRVISCDASDPPSLDYSPGGLCFERSRKRAELRLTQVEELGLELYLDRSHTGLP